MTVMEQRLLASVSPRKKINIIIPHGLFFAQVFDEDNAAFSA